MSSVNIMQNTNGSATLGSSPDQGLHTEAVEWIATSVDKYFYIATRPERVTAITGRTSVAGTGGAATATIRKVPSGTALTSGTALHSGSINLVGTIDTNQSLTLSTTPGVLDLAAGDALAIDFTGTLTSAVGCASVSLSPKA